MSELAAGLKEILNQAVDAHNRLMTVYRDAAAGEGATSSAGGEAPPPSLAILDAAADMNSAYTKLGKLILRLDPDALN
ncbi:hypothetical protein [Tsukamurella spumae]|uniref:PE domain-containing protein n=1 Tax=Tsukamurella spumae TaxID=44753 RepID=A0A846X189_9ACTN|nr:hypothetical protein [Tsukamurella spumae]NKY18346.1 hypothetical protein [Tsukamurella spumae]